MSLDRVEIQAQLDQLQFDASDIEGTCHTMTVNMNVEECEEGDMMDMEEEEEPMVAASRKAKKGKKAKKAKKGKKSKGKGKNQQDVPEMPEIVMPDLTTEEKAEMDASIKQTVKDLAYVGCVMNKVEMGCYEAVASEMMTEPEEEMLTGRRK